MTSGDLAKDVLEAEEQLEMHQERKAEIDGRHEHYMSLRQRGDTLIEQKHYACYEIQVKLNKIENYPTLKTVTRITRLPIHRCPYYYQHSWKRSGVLYQS